jgi:hypothetical protein
MLRNSWVDEQLDWYLDVQNSFNSCCVGMLAHLTTFSQEATVSKLDQFGEYSE